MAPGNDKDPKKISLSKKGATTQATVESSIEALKDIRLARKGSVRSDQAVITPPVDSSGTLLARKANKVESFLQEHGLVQYKELFSTNRIDMDILLELGEADLVEMGMDKLGDRKRLMKGLSLCRDTPETSPPEQVNTPSSAQDVPEPTRFKVLLVSFGPRKIGVIKEIRSVTGLGLADAKKLVEGVPSEVMTNVSLPAAKTLQRQLEQVGASVRIEGIHAAGEPEPPSPQSIVERFRAPNPSIRGLEDYIELIGERQVGRVGQHILTNYRLLLVVDQQRLNIPLADLQVYDMSTGPLIMKWQDEDGRSNQLSITGTIVKSSFVLGAINAKEWKARWSGSEQVQAVHFLRMTRKGLSVQNSEFVPTGLDTLDSTQPETSLTVRDSSTERGLTPDIVHPIPTTFPTNLQNIGDQFNRIVKEKTQQTRSRFSVGRVVMCFLLPPVAVLDKGCGAIFFVALLTVWGWWPGIIAALVVNSTKK